MGLSAKPDPKARQGLPRALRSPPRGQWPIGLPETNGDVVVWSVVGAVLLVGLYIVLCLILQKL